ncbi:MULTISPECIES: hypothetical protein [unclassified Algoriphagus]|jgi:hypothetical protein|uniref:hypothetical protein n=1 Tax=unclassified Algoriphagus TaxID=2641541 RepID=UPI001F313237|nr:hypothetical protein [Algoriphagus sp. AGSA1]MCE7053679.1 hypothetical protein [Algoriphagus sp. AGSA1]
MNTLIKRLPAFAFVIAAFAAFAFNAPVIGGEPTATKIWTPDATQSNGYRDVTILVQSEDYECNASEMYCLVEFHNDNPATGILNVLSEGEFVEL